MPDSAPDPVADRVAARLDECCDLAAVQGDVAVLLAAVEAVLAEHRKMTIYALSVLAHDSHEPPRVWCGHTYEETENGRHVMADDDTIICLDKPEGDVCENCYEEGGEAVAWP